MRCIAFWEYDPDDTPTVIDKIKQRESAYPIHACMTGRIKTKRKKTLLESLPEEISAR